MQDDRSLLDDITSSAKDLQKNLSAQDKSRITDYLDNLREIERRIAQVEKRNTDQQSSVSNAPIDIPETYEDHVGLMFDLQVVAFQAYITRVSTFMMSRRAQTTAPTLTSEFPNNTTPSRITSTIR